MKKLIILSLLNIFFCSTTYPYYLIQLSNPSQGITQNLCYVYIPNDTLSEQSKCMHFMNQYKNIQGCIPFDRVIDCVQSEIQPPIDLPKCTDACPVSEME